MIPLLGLLPGLSSLGGALLRPLAVLGVAALLFGGGYCSGHHQAATAAAEEAHADELARIKAIDRATVEAQADATVTVAQLQVQLKAARSYAATIEKRLNHAHLAVACPAAGPDAPAPDAQGDAGGRDGPLTLGAVSLWNSALAGADVPAGACGADDPTSPACATDSGLDLQDAWRNHAANAASCAEDRARYQRLIEYLQRRQDGMKQQEGSTP